MLLLKDPDKAVAGAIDVVGLVLLAAGLGSMQYVLTEGEQNYWFADPTIVAMTFVMVVTLAGFVFWELFGTTTPVVDLRILRNRSVAAGSFLAVALGVVIFGSTYTLPQFTQGPLGFTPSLSGFLFIFRAAPILVVAPLIVRLTGKVDARVFLALGFIIVGIGTSIQAWVTTSDAGFWTFAIPLALTGAGSAMLFIPLSIAILGATTPADGPKASAFINLSTQLGGSIAVAGLAAYLDQRQFIQADALRTNATLANVAIQEFLKTNPATALSDLVNGQALILAYSDATMVIAYVALLGVPFVLLMRKPTAKREAAAPVVMPAGGAARVGPPTSSQPEAA
jgi:DHA2 family multidrug resistance protein